MDGFRVIDGDVRFQQKKDCKWDNQENLFGLF